MNPIDNVAVGLVKVLVGSLLIRLLIGVPIFALACIYVFTITAIAPQYDRTWSYKKRLKASESGIELQMQRVADYNKLHPDPKTLTKAEAAELVEKWKALERYNDFIEEVEEAFK